MLASLRKMFGGKKVAAPVAARSFSAADYSRITSSMDTESQHIMSIMRSQGKALRARSRQVVTNTAYGAKFQHLVETNVCGPTPFRFQAKVKYSSGKFDTGANARLEKEWDDSGRPANFDYEGRLSRKMFLQLATKTWAADGEILIRIHEGSNSGPWGTQLQLLDVDRLDEDKNEELAGGNVIVTGVELDPSGRAVAYHLLKRKPRDWQFGYSREYVRIPAEQIIHLFRPMYAEQVRGVPPMYAAILKLHQMGAFEDAAIVAARIGASKMGIYKRKEGYDGQTRVPGATINSMGDFIQSAEPGEFGFTPDGYELDSGWNPNYPDAQVGPFIKAILRGAAASVNLSYTSFAGDREATNFSSARADILDDRDYWMVLQEWLSESLMTPLYERWLSNAILRRKLPFPLERIEKYQDVYFQPKRWAWVDPSRDITANTDAVKLRVKTRTQIAAEQGRDIEDVFDEFKREEDLAKDKGIDLNLYDGKQGANNGQQQTDPDQDGE